MASPMSVSITPNTLTDLTIIIETSEFTEVRNLSDCTIGRDISFSLERPKYENCSVKLFSTGYKPTMIQPSGITNLVELTPTTDYSNLSDGMNIYYVKDEYSRQFENALLDMVQEKADKSEIPSIPTNYVTTDTTQNITETKTFEKEIKAELASYVAYNGSTNNLPYKKIGEVVLNGTNASAVVPFLYFRTNVEKSSNNYLGKIVLRTDGTTAGHINTGATGIVLDEVPDYINSGDMNFYVLYKESTPDSSKVTFEFWVYVKNTWAGLSITPLKQSTGGTGYSMTNWTWYNNPTGVAEIPDGYTGQIEKNIISNYIATPAASDDSMKAANTEFVHDAIALDAVTLTGTQDISDIKRFGASNCLMVTSANITKGTNPTSNQYLNIGFTEKNASSYTSRIGCVEVALFSDGAVTSYLRAYKNIAAGTATADLSVTYPASGNPYANCPTPTEDTTSSTQIDTVGARNTKLANYATNSTLSSSPYLVLYGTSTSAADATAKIVEISSSYATTPTISAGQLLIVKPTITSTVADSTITVQKSSTTLLAAKTMKYNNTNITTSTDSIVWSANVPSIFVYDGSYWQFLGHGLDNNTTYSAMSVSEGTTGTATSSRVMRADYLKQIIEGLAISQTNTYYNSASSTLYIG